MKTIYLKVEVPDTIPDPELTVNARVKDTFDEWEEVNCSEIHLPTDDEVESYALENVLDEDSLEGFEDVRKFAEGANFVINNIK